MNNTPEIYTPRLCLRRFTEDDSNAYYSIGSDKEVNTFLPMFPFETIEEAKLHLREKYLNSYNNEMGFRYAICLKSDNIPIGYVDVADNDSHDLGYCLKKEFWHSGIVSEACEAVVNQLRASSIPYITATHDVNNPRSGSVMKRIGMIYRYSYEEQWQPKNIPVTFRMYQMNFDGNDERVYKKYWDMYPIHFVEKGV